MHPKSPPNPLSARDPPSSQIAGVLRTSTDPVVLTLVERFALLERDPEKEVIVVERL